MTTTEAFEQFLKNTPSPKTWGVSKQYFTRLRAQHKNNQITLNRMEMILIRSGYHKSIVESWEKK